ncbi:MAG: LamG domain-containing protein [Phycisphaerales bacterium]|nr:LamG domain-containing protein [Phycisphaerales bacterium]
MKTSVFYRAACAAFGSVLVAGAAQAAPTAWWAPYSADANTIGLWHFDDVDNSSTTFADSSGNSNTGTINTASGGGYTVASPTASGAGAGPGIGLFDDALKFDPHGGSGGLSAPAQWGSVDNSTDQLAYVNAMTIEAWINPDAGDLGGGLNYPIGARVGNLGWSIGIQSKQVFFDMALGSDNTYHYGQSGDVLTAGTWTHVAGTLSNDGATTTLNLYINDTLAATDSWAEATLNTYTQIAPAMNIGTYGTGAVNALYGGQIDEVRLSNVAREFGAVPVPEPTSLALLSLGGLFLVRRRTVA